MTSEMPTNKDYALAMTKIYHAALAIANVASWASHGSQPDNEKQRYWSDLKEAFAALQKDMNDLRVAMPRQG